MTGEEIAKMYGADAEYCRKWRAKISDTIQKCGVEKHVADERAENFINAAMLAWYGPSVSKSTGA